MDVSAIGSVDPSNPLYQCTFQNSTNSALYVNNSQDLIIRNANFPSVLFGNNVTKFFDTGHVTFKDATGAYAGAAYEYDPNNRIDWSASQPGLWTGLVSTDWHNTGNWDDLTVPTASTNVTIPTGTPNMPVIGSSAAYCNNLTIAGMLTIRNRTADVAGNVNITGLLAMEDVSRLNVLGDMNWNAGSTASVSAVTSMYVSGNWTFTAGSNAQLTNGSVEFTGAVSKKIFIYSATSSFNDVHIDKSGGASMTYDFASTGPMRTKGLFVRINSNFISNSLLNNIIVTGNVYSFGIMALNATVIEFTGTDHILLPNVNDYYGGFMFKQSGTVTINQSNTNTVDVRGGIYIYSGIFSPGNSILKIQNRWENNSGSPAFAEGTSRVIFTGTTPLYCSTEQFYIVEIDKSSNYLYVDYNATMTCQIFDWTQGGMWIYNNGSFSAADLADDGIYGSFVMEGNLVELHQDAAQRVDLRGNITISAGQFNVYGGVDNSYWGSGANASLTMTSGVFDMVDQAIIVQDVAPFSFTSAITGGTIRTQRGMLAHTSGFNPDGGLVEIYGNQNAPLGSDNGAAFYNVTINKPDGMTRTSLWSLLVKNNLTVEEGMAELSFGQVLECQGDIDVNQGGWFAVTSGTVKMADLTAINVNNGGDLSSEGYEGAPSVFTIIEPPSSFAFNVNSGGNMTVYHSVFEYMGEQGINIAAGAIVNTWKEFNNCEFRNGQSGAYPLLSINNNQVLVIKDAIFPENTWGGTYNVSKGVSSGHLYFINATGAFAGEGFENDPYDLIDWIDPLSAIATATPQTICAGSSSQLDVIRTGGLAPFTYLWSPAAGLSDPGISNPIASPLASTSYSVTVTDALGQMATSEVFLTVNPPLIVSVTISAWYNPSPPGTMVTFSAYPTNGGITPSYQWKVNGSDVGSDLDTYAYYPLNGDQVTCVLTSSAPCVIGNPATSNIITMAMVPVYTNVSGDILAGTDTCYNASATITVPVAPATFNVYPGGSATFIAGVRVRFLPGARVQPGGYVHAYITTTNEYCGSLPPAMVAVVAGDKETSSLSVEPYQTFSIYPNPTSGAFTLLNRSDFFTGKVEVDIYNLSGGKSLSTTYTNERSHVFTLGELPPGIYFVKVKAGDLMESHKLIVTR
ncbi:MAG: T9SS type A sorting domain-containing protein [Bacteroidetes bacterium]|nr:T9SS type A sorting domain-containing protein [Bacteroidota bacterium]